jgi:hypothetical protein
MEMPLVFLQHRSTLLQSMLANFDCSTADSKSVCLEAYLENVSVLRVILNVIEKHFSGIFAIRL